MNRQVVVVAVAAVGLAGAAAFILMRPEAPAREPAAAARPAPAPASAPRAPEAETPAPEPRARPAPPPPVVAPSVAEAPPPVVEAVPAAGTLRIDVDVPGAQVFIDRRFLGAAPVTAENLTPGAHQLNVSAKGFESYASSIDVSPGQRDMVIKLKEVRLDSSVEVIHKHGIGSCRGRLIATPQGLRYETSNRADSFTTALLSLETFQVDYLAKNLRVKLSNGKQFNFTDPDGNADRLFVFHRDVDKARERLKKGDPPATN